MSAQSRQRTYTQYVKPEASDGLDKFRVFLSTDVNTMKRLPKYDFANAKLNISLEVIDSWKKQSAIAN